ncbi:MAG: hypothetical protein Q8N88_03405, partial [Nanoarchaeota archaeon]|nr:hypothetical protein [Nanoarchaeota archaeon]
EETIIVISIPNEKLVRLVKKFLLTLGLFPLLFPNVPREMSDEYHLHCFGLNKLKKIIKDDYIIKKAKRIPFNILPLGYVVQLKIK